MNFEYAPIIITTLNRYDHLVRCVESLRDCTLSNKTELYIALDYPLTEAHWEGYLKVLDYTKKIIGFLSVNIIKRDNNFGAQKNSLEAINHLFSKNSKLIFTEDDNIFSKDFLVFINKCLNKYENVSNIFSISGYNYPINTFKNYNEDIYIWQGYSAWGVGLWKNKFKQIDWTDEHIFNNINVSLRNIKLVYKINKISNNYIPALLHMYNIKQIHGDTYLSLHQILNNSYSVFPTISRVRNMGHDGSGINAGVNKTNIFSTQKIFLGTEDYKIPERISGSKIINKILFQYFKSSSVNQIKNFVKLLIFRFINN